MNSSNKLNLALEQMYSADCNFISDVLKKYFIFDKIFNLLDYDNDMSMLYEDLKKLKKESYDVNYRFIFFHYDTDYYITNSQPGLTLRNLQRIIVSLDISNYFCLILSHQDIDKELEILRQEETTDDCAISCIQHFLQKLIPIKITYINLNPENITTKYQSLCGARRSHRTLLYSLLRRNSLLDQGQVSYCAINQH